MKGQTPVAASEILGQFLHNQQAGDAALALIQHSPDFLSLFRRLQHVDQNTFMRDFLDSSRGPRFGLRVGDENASQLGDRFGAGFTNSVLAAERQIGRLNAAVKDLDVRFPELVDNVLMGTAAFLGFVSAVGALGFIAGPVGAGLRLLWSPLRLLVSGMAFLSRGVSAAMLAFDGLLLSAAPFLVIAGLVAAAGIDIYRNWDQFGPMFRQLDDALGEIGDGMAEFWHGLTNNDPAEATQGLADAWRGVQDAWRTAWGTGGPMERLFTDFADWVDSWTDGFATALGEWMTRALDHVTPIIKDIVKGWRDFFRDFGTEIDNLLARIPRAPAPAGQRQQRLNTGRDPDGSDDWGLPGTEHLPIGPPRRDAAPAPAPAAPPPQRVEVEVRLHPIPGFGMEAERRDGDAPGRPAPDRGPVLDRP